MSEDYSRILFNPNISLDEMCKKIVGRENLFKYQSFYNTSNRKRTKNQYWEKNMIGEFHLSRGCEFEDRNDCKPFINPLLVHRIILQFVDANPTINVIELIKTLNTEISDKYLQSVIDNYQTDIRIGCFTARNDNEKMWAKYSDIGRGYCIEYDTSKNVLFQQATLPVYYDDRPYDSSTTLANEIILEAVKKAKGRTDEENFEIFKSAYEKILKTAYIPLFIKQKGKWDFEEEQRMFILKRRTTSWGKLNMRDVLNQNSNIDLSQSIKSIYLGPRFESLPNHKKILQKINSITPSTVNLYQIRIVNKKYINERIQREKI